MAARTTQKLDFCFLTVWLFLLNEFFQKVQKKNPSNFPEHKDSSPIYDDKWRMKQETLALRKLNQIKIADDYI